jgi:hypothetical protein
MTVSDVLGKICNAILGKFTVFICTTFTLANIIFKASMWLDPFKLLVA